MKSTVRQKFTDYRYWAGLGAITLGILIGIQMGIDAHISSIPRARLTVEDKERLRGIVLNLGPGIIGSTLGLYTVMWVFAPMPPVDSANVLQAYARRKLRQPLLTQSESEFWAKIMEDTKDEQSA
ncbi:MAG: hypothetical protein F6K19_50475 [Cyanothece sp. SIO1E1]|nr:hypothetical protein [Cyanothece sp. SIO1E1]